MNLWRTMFNPLKRLSIEIQGYVFPLALQMLTNIYSIFMFNQDNSCFIKGFQHFIMFHSQILALNISTYY